MKVFIKYGFFDLVTLSLFLSASLPDMFVMYCKRCEALLRLCIDSCNCGFLRCSIAFLRKSFFASACVMI